MISECPMRDENNLIYSPLQQTYTADGKSVDIKIYRLPDSGWTLEVVDQYNNSIVWDDEFESDQEALALALIEFKEEGIAAFIGVDPGDELS